MRTLAIVVLGVSICPAAPTVTTAVNAAHNMPGALPNGGLARGGLATIYGSGLGPAQLAQSGEFPLRTAMSGTSARVSVDGTTVDCLITYTQANQVGVIVPSPTPAGDGTLTLTYNGETSASVPVRVVDSSPGLFTRNQAGSGPAIAQNALAATDLRTNSITAPARPGQVVVLSGTGFGPVSGNEAERTWPGDLPIALELYVGGQPASVTYKGRSECCAGVDQISFTVPPNSSGCYVPVAARMGSFVSNFATISVDAAGRGCSDPYGPNAEDLDLLRETGTLAFMLVDLTRIGFDGQFADSGDALSMRTEHDRLAAAVGTRSIPLGTCVAQWSPGGAASDIRVAQGLDSGTVSVTVNGESRPMLPRFGSPGLYSGNFNRFLEVGPALVDNGPGGTEVGSFRASVQIPEAVRFLNADAIREVPRSEDLAVRWSGAVSDRDSVIVYGVAPSTDATAGFYCVADPAAERFTVPAWVLSALPASAEGVLGVGTTLRTASRFRADGIRFGAIAASNLTVKNVAYR